LAGAERTLRTLLATGHVDDVQNGLQDVLSNGAHRVPGGWVVSLRLLQARSQLGTDAELVAALLAQRAELRAPWLAITAARCQEAGQLPDDWSLIDMVSRLTPEEMEALGKYFAAKSAPPETVKDPDLAAVGRYIFYKGNKFSGLPSCATCHGKDGMGTASLPRLAGQYASYVQAQLKLFGKRERTNDNAVMHSVAANLSPLEMAAVAEYVSGQ